MTRKNEPGGDGRAHHLIRAAFGAAGKGDREAHDRAWETIDREGHKVKGHIRRYTKYLLRIHEKKGPRTVLE